MNVKRIAITIGIVVFFALAASGVLDSEEEDASQSSNVPESSSARSSSSTNSEPSTSTPNPNAVGDNEVPEASETTSEEEDDEDEEDRIEYLKMRRSDVAAFVTRWNSGNPKNRIADKQIKYYEDGNGAAAEIKIGSIVCEFSGYEGTHDTFSVKSKKLPLTEDGRKKFLKYATKAFAAYYALTQKKAASIINALSNGKAGKRSDYMSYSYKNYDLVLHTDTLEGYHYDLFTDKDSPLDKYFGR